ncbi:protein CFAP276 [Mugil cephalus]|uniref:protein CFAP276 n=1 Tax=Mugil cephalus TaxID=48193 RepID=UPI001FB70FD2|nr:protein CFAP276 [Mugil cephalus]XP_047426894.1 protein CFAP276 [Mugil cephalus]
MSSRDPFPSPKFENGFTLSGFKPQQRKTFDKPTHIAQTEEPWRRLYDTATVASTRQSVQHREDQALRNSLDLHLKSIYDHNKDVFWSKNQVLYQKETVSENHRKQAILEQKAKQKNEEESKIRVWVDSQRGSIYSVK